MEQFSIYPPVSADELRAGRLLIAEPLLKDANFSRTVIFLCEHSNDGSVGFVLNQHTGMRLGDLVEGVPEKKGPSVYKGGPVQPDTLHMMHRLADRLGDAKEVTGGVFWGGSFEDLCDLVVDGKVKNTDVRLFLGYSGWAPGQLEQEINEGTWLIADATEQLLFSTPHDDVWRKAIELLGKKYGHLAHIPTDPQMN